MLFLTATAVFFGFWQGSVIAGMFMFCLLWTIADIWMESK